jgi:hypothetical protein
MKAKLLPTCPYVRLSTRPTSLEHLEVSQAECGILNGECSVRFVLQCQ